MTSVPLILAERNVPRYTSYPTAPHFSPTVGARDCAGWLAALRPEATLSLYIHVPFCIHLCLYCGCNTKAMRRRDPVEQYADRLIDEIRLLADVIGTRRVVHLHWGGGTPSILGPERLTGIVDEIARRFDLGSLREHAMELDPRRMSPELVAALAAIGVDRVSFGVQEFAPEVQEAIGRVQPFAQVADAVGAVRAAGIARVNIDLMYGLPRQTAAHVAASATLAAKLAPQRLALFGYAHVPWFKPHQRLIDEAALPEAAARLEQARVAGETLASHGYDLIGLDHFARPDDELAVAQRAGRLHRNFQGYTTDAADALIGIGTSAIGRLPQGFVQNAADTGGYSRAVQAGSFATARGLRFTSDDRLRAGIIERLMCDLAVDLDALAPGQDFTPELQLLTDLTEAGMVRISGRRVVVTEQGRPFVRLAAAAFDAYLPQNHTRHSVAV
jgi:oxygen-independent coproporphyrinogen-3 oxidase